MTVSASLAASVLTAALAVATAQPPSTTPAFPAGAEAVTVDVIVLDKDGRPVPDLTRDDFVVEEDGRVQAIGTFDSVRVADETVPAAPVTAVEAAERPAVSSNLKPGRSGRTLVIVFDDVHLTPIRAEAARKAVIAFATADGYRGDRVTLVPASGGTWWTTVLPQGAADLAGALHRLKGLRIRDTSARQLSDFEALRIYRYRDEALRTEVYTRLIELGQFGDTDSGRGADNSYPLRGLQLAAGKSMVDGMAAATFIAAEQRIKATLALLERVLASLGSQPGKKTVLLVSEGFVHDPQIEGFAAIARRASEVNAEIDFVDARSLEADLPAMADAEIRAAANPTKALGILQRARLETQGAESIALDTGGLVLRGGNNLGGALRRASEASRSYYLLGYQPANPGADGKFRRIEVKVTRPGLTVRARKGYYARGVEPRAKPNAIDPEVARALDAPEPPADIPMRMAAYRIAAADDGKTKVRLTAELDPKALAFETKDERWQDTLSTFFVVASRETGGREGHQSALDLSLPAEALARLKATWLPLQRDFDLRPGVYQARLTVRDGNAQRLASVVHDFEVPAPEGLRFTTPVLTDTIVAPARADDPPRPARLARRAFAVGSRLYCQFEVMGANSGAPISAGHELRRVGGRVLAHLDPTPMPPGPDGHVTRLLAISLRTTEPGEHELVLTARDAATGKTVETRERFLVVTPEEAAALGAVVAAAPDGPPSGPGGSHGTGDAQARASR